MPKSVPSVLLSEVNVVIRGRFNPAIFSPAWFYSQELIGPEEYEAAQTEVITRDFAAFQAGWLRCQSSLEHFTASTLDFDESERVRDVAVGVLRLLPHTPLSALGINVDLHFAVPDEETWHRIGDTLAPKQYWSNLNVPGMSSLRIEALRPDLYAGRIHVTVEPSQRQPNAIFVSQNDHFDLERVSTIATRKTALPVPTEAKHSAEKMPEALHVLETEWKASLRRAQVVLEDIAALGQGANQ